MSGLIFMAGLWVVLAGTAAPQANSALYTNLAKPFFAMI
jgi:hypothetical protein